MRRRTSTPRDRTLPPDRTHAGGRRRAPTQSAAHRRHRKPQNDSALQAEAQRPSSAPNSPLVLYDTFHRCVTRLLHPRSSALTLAEVPRLTLRAPNRATTSREPRTAAHRARFRERPLATGDVVRRNGGRVLRAPPPDVLRAAGPAPAMPAAQHRRIRPEQNYGPVPPATRTPPRFLRFVTAIFPRNFCFAGRLRAVRLLACQINNPPSKTAASRQQGRSGGAAVFSGTSAISTPPALLDSDARTRR